MIEAAIAGAAAFLVTYTAAITLYRIAHAAFLLQDYLRCSPWERRRYYSRGLLRNLFSLHPH